MNLHELDRYKLSDAVKFNARLNPRLWGKDEHLKPEVRDALMKIADDFRSSLGVDNLSVKDITVSGSNAAYTYTPNSDIDLHLVVDLPEADVSEVYRELFDAKKYAYNNQHNIKIGGYDVELYVQNANEPPVSQGEYSLLNNDWLQVPRRQRADIVDRSTRSKYQDLKRRIKDAIKTKDYDVMAELMAKIRHLRQSGLDEHGEFGPENLAFKMLRTQGYIKQLADARTAAKDQELSIDERAKPRVTYGFTTESKDDLQDTINQFAASCIDYLKIKKAPQIELHTSTDWSEQTGSFGQYDPDSNVLHLATSGRHTLDILRTMAHEFTHRKQAEKETLPPDAGETGSRWEDEANAMAGRIMRHWAEKHPEMFASVPLEEASGYIPTRKQAKDPRFVMALTKDVRPGAVGKEANKLGLQTDAQGHPALLTATLNESLAQELEAFKAQDLFEVKMTSKNLAKLAKDIPGVKVGLEFEMIVPNVANEENSDLEPDYDQDERVRDIDDAVNFFDDGDYNGRNEIRRLRERMESDYFDWQTEQIDQEWDRNGFEFFQEYLDREEPFDPEDYQERAEDEIKAEFPDMDPTSEDFGELVAEKLREINSEYYVETWEAQGRSYDYAREEFEEEHRDNYSESDWLSDQNIRYASDVESNYGDVSWPYWSSNSDSESDIETVALDFMNAMGMDSVAISSSYHGSYKKWVGNGWVGIGSNKPDDCFTIEPDGSLEGDDPNDTGLEFVSPPIPLEDIGTVMNKVQNWAGNYGAYTGDQNKTSIHTNISVPGYDLDKLDYLKAALLLGDEYVLREFDRIGNTYAAPAIEKVKQLVKQNPEKAQALLDKMKSQLNAEASKLIHSGQTNKFTSINTKDNRVEFRSPGGDYLSIIADNPQKMIDTINRMVVTLDAAMDPNKYKEEYQKKLYKVLTGQAGGREAKTGAKQEMKASDKDLLNIFSRYAAGELPKAALKSFVRQAQLERKGKKADAALASHNWAIRRRDTGDIVRTFQADDYNQAFDVLQQYKQQHNITDNSLTYGPYNPSEEKPAEQGGGLYKIYDTRGTLIAGDEYGSDRAALARAGVWAMQRGVDVVVKNAQGQEVGRVSASGEITPATQQSPGSTLNGRPSNPEGRYVIVPENDRNNVVYRFEAAGPDDANIVLRQWRQANPDQIWVTLRDDNRVLGQPGKSQPVPGSTLDLQRQRAAAAQQSAPQTGNWGIWMANADRFARQTGTGDPGPASLRRFPSREAAEEFLTHTRAENPRMRTDVEVREIPADYQMPGSATAQEPQGVDTRVDYELYNRTTGAVIDTFQARNDDEATTRLDDYREHGDHGQARHIATQMFGVRRGPGVTNTAPQPAGNTDAAQGGLVDVAGEQPVAAPQTLTRPGQGQQVFTGYWKVLDPDGEEVYRFNGVGNSQADANRVAADWMRNNGNYNAGFDVIPVMGEA